MSNISDLESAIKRIEDTLDTIDERTNVLERLHSKEGIDELRMQIVRERREKKKLERKREWLLGLIGRILESRSILKRYFEEEALYEKDGKLYIIHDGRTYPADLPFGIFQPKDDAKTAWLKSEKDLMDARLLEKKFEEWDDLFDPKELERQLTKINGLSREELDALIEDIGKRLERFKAGYMDTSTGEGGVSQAPGAPRFPPMRPRGGR